MRKNCNDCGRYKEVYDCFYIPEDECWVPLYCLRVRNEEEMETLR